MTCIWCDSDRTGLLHPAISRYRSHLFDVWGCDACGCRFSPWNQAVDVDYEQVQANHAWYRLLECDARMVHNILANGPEPFWINMAAQYLNQIVWNCDRRHRAVLHDLMTAAAGGRSLRVLEVGCNRGFIGGIAARLGHDYLGVDLPNGALQQAISDFAPFGAKFGEVSEEWLTRGAGGENYDLVYSSETIEHVPAPRLFCMRLLGMVAPGGKLIFTTPDLEFMPLQLWGTELPPIHTVLLRKSSILGLLRTMAPAFSAECYNEELEPDSTQPVPACAGHPDDLCRPVGTLDVDPSSASFEYHVANLHIPLAPVPRNRPLRDESQFLTAPSPAAGHRRGSSIIVEVIRKG